jgi:hypothetical protein
LLITVTSAPGTTPPELSRTHPAIAPVEIPFCAEARKTPRTNRAATERKVLPIRLRTFWQRIGK